MPSSAETLFLRPLFSVVFLGRCGGDKLWTQFYPPELATRLQHLIDTPGG